MYTDAWRSLRDLITADPWRTSFNYRGDNKASMTPLLYPDACFASPFLSYEPKFQEEDEASNLLLFTEGVLRPRLKQLAFYSGLEDSLPTHYEYLTESKEEYICEGICTTDKTYSDENLGIQYRFIVYFDQPVGFYLS